MATYSGRNIDESFVPLDKRGHKEYRRLYPKLLSELNSPGAIELFSTHEAGHLIFSRKAEFTLLKFFGPTMTYNPFKDVTDESERYNYFYAAVHAQETTQIARYNDEILVQLANIAVAGEVFNEVLQKQPEIPIKKSPDFDSFDDHCRKAFRRDEIKYEPVKWWRRGRKVVAEFLAKRTDDAEIELAIIEIKLKCFDLQ